MLPTLGKLVKVRDLADEIKLLRVELLDGGDQPISGYTRHDASALYGNSVRIPVTWGDKSDLRSLAGKPIKLRFLMRDCKLYAFQFVNR